MTPVEERRKRSLTDEDIEEIRGITCQCPHGMTSEDVFRLRDFLKWWEGAKSTVGGYVIKTVILLIVCVGILVAWITNK